MTTTEDTTRLKEQLSHLSERLDYLLSRKDFDEFDLGRVRVYLGMALGITSGVAPRIGEENGFMWAHDVASLRSPGELSALKIAIFSRANSALRVAAEA